MNENFQSELSGYVSDLSNKAAVKQAAKQKIVDAQSEENLAAAGEKAILQEIVTICQQKLSQLG